MPILLAVSTSPQGYRPLVRRARTSDVPAIKQLVDTYAGKILLEKNLVTLYEAVQEFWVAEHEGRVVGCGALHVLWADLGEVRTVAVNPAMTGHGIGHAIVDRLLEVARELALKRLFVLTFETGSSRGTGSPRSRARPSPPRCSRRCAAPTTSVWLSS